MEGTLTQKLGNWQQVVLDNLEAYAIFVTDVDGTILTWQPSVESVLEFDEAFFIGQRFHIIFALAARAGKMRL